MVGPLVRPGRLRIRGLSTRGRGFAPRLPRRSPARGRGDGFGGDVAGASSIFAAGGVDGRACAGGMDGGLAPPGRRSVMLGTIGTGESLAAPPLPHHRADGSVCGGSAASSGGMRILRPGAGRSGPARDAGRRAYTRRPLRPCRTRTARTYADRTRPPVASEDPRRWHAPRPRHRARHGPARGLAARPRAGVLRSPRRPATAPRRRMPMAADSPLSVPRPAPRMVSHAGRLVQDLRRSRRGRRCARSLTGSCRAPTGGPCPRACTSTRPSTTR